MTIRQALRNLFTGPLIADDPDPKLSFLDFLDGLGVVEEDDDE